MSGALQAPWFTGLDDRLDQISFELADQEQGTDDWHKARLGKITGSRFKDLLTKPRNKSVQWSDTAFAYFCQLIAERVTGKWDELHTKDMAWGTRYEPAAISEYSIKRGVKVDKVGFMPYIDGEGEHMIGCSVDGIVGDDGCLEVKCPATPKNHWRTIVTGEVPKEYTAQVQGHMMVTGREWCDFVTFDPRVEGAGRIHVIRVDRDEEFIEAMLERLLAGEAFLNEQMKRLDL